jgi:DNA invertase Pin-like site-specific DNA recombinase
MGLIGYARMSTTEDRQVLERQLDTLSQAGCERPALAACIRLIQA